MTRETEGSEKRTAAPGLGAPEPANDGRLARAGEEAPRTSRTAATAAPENPVPPTAPGCPCTADTSRDSLPQKARGREGVPFSQLSTSTTSGGGRKAPGAPRRASSGPGSGWGGAVPLPPGTS